MSMFTRPAIVPLVPTPGRRKRESYNHPGPYAQRERLGKGLLVISGVHDLLAEIRRRVPSVDEG